MDAVGPCDYRLSEAGYSPSGIRKLACMILPRLCTGNPSLTTKFDSAPYPLKRRIELEAERQKARGVVYAQTMSMR